MWNSKNHNKAFWNVILGFAIVVLLVGMLFGYTQITQRQEAEDQALMELANQEKLENQTTKEESYKILEEDYQKDMSTVAEYLPGIVCWGDVLTEGAASGISYPKTLQLLINKYLVSPYDFRSTVDNPFQYTRVDWKQFTTEIPVVNMGTGEESTQTILGRSGVAPYVVSKDFTVPEDCSPVSIRFTGFDGQAAAPLTMGDLEFNPVTINGLEGRITWDPDAHLYSSDGEYYFTRSTAGEELVIEKGAEIIPASSALYRDYISVIFIGSYGQYKDAEELVSHVRLMLSRQQKNKDRFIIIGNYTGNGQSSDFYDHFASLMTQEYGDRFINFRKYLLNEALPEYGIKPTNKDTSNIGMGRIPESLLVTGSHTELQAFLYEKLGQMVFERMDSLGYFDEFREELKVLSVEELDAAALQ